MGLEAGTLLFFFWEANEQAGGSSHLSPRVNGFIPSSGSRIVSAWGDLVETGWGFLDLHIPEILGIVDTQM